EVKHNTLVNNKSFIKLLNKRSVFTITSQELKKMQLKHFSPKIKLLVIVPLIHAQQPLGFIFLYYTNKNSLETNEIELLSIYKNAAVLALTKAKLQEQSQKALEIRDRFISLASHELRTPLTSIHGYIQLLHTKVKDKDSVESRWVQELYIESIRMTQLVKELLDVNRIKQGQFAFVFSEVPMHEVVTRAIDRYRLTNADHPFILQSKVLNHQSVVVGDFDKLVEMVSGLLGNAVKFSKPGEKIVISLKQTPNAISLEVKDTGKGISKKDIAAIFNGFYKAENASYIEGMGVGLLLAQHIVDNHRGKLKIKSKENKGTSVTVSLPTIKTSNF
ncbi:MAG TPA: HAMP domain-containing sensor histidine kinase, partial [Candidatus Saccharimonadales bacterium]|nr:HAMP domain-containing sensor histidine kinase [Candidatus Saccharimonadales bacterium]